jgi:alcohol dehydrogenase class IV
MPTKIIMGAGCVRKHSALLSALGKRALIVTGKYSARKNGSLEDTKTALAEQGLVFSVYDHVAPNPSPATCREIAQAAKTFAADFVIGLGGGSALDAAKAAAALAKNDLLDGELFAGSFANGALPVVAIPTTAGTGSEVTPSAILTNDTEQNKTSVSAESLFPAIAFLDSSYTAKLPRDITINTALDALSHAAEGYAANKSDPWSRAIALSALRIFGRALPALLSGSVTPEIRDALLLASNMAGVVIAHTGTTIVHAMGYSLTYFKNIDHGRANGLILGPYLELISKRNPVLVREILLALDCPSTQAFAQQLDRLLGPKESLSPDEIQAFSEKAIRAKHVGNTPCELNAADVADLYRLAFGSGSIPL